MLAPQAGIPGWLIGEDGEPLVPALAIAAEYLVAQGKAVEGHDQRDARRGTPTPASLLVRLLTPFGQGCAKCSSPPGALLKTHPDSLNRVDEADAVENALPPPTGCSPSSRIPRPDRVSAISRAIDQSARRPGSGSELATRRRNHCRIVSEARSSPPLTRKIDASRGETLSGVTSWYQPAVIAKNG